MRVWFGIPKSKESAFYGIVTFKRRIDDPVRKEQITDNGEMSVKEEFKRKHPVTNNLRTRLR